MSRGVQNLSLAKLKLRTPATTLLHRLPPPRQLFHHHLQRANTGNGLLRRSRFGALQNVQQM